MSKWDERYLNVAREISQWSKDRTKIGSVAVGDNGQILCQGYNGFPRGVIDQADRLEDRSTKLAYMVHAEMNCIYNACNSGVSLRGAALYVHGLPVCSECAKGVIQVGVNRVVERYDMGKFTSAPHWVESGRLSKTMFQEAGVECVSIAF